MVIFHNKLHSVAPGWIAWDGTSLTAGDFLEIAEGHHSEEEESKGTLGREFGGGGGVVYLSGWCHSANVGVSGSVNSKMQQQFEVSYSYRVCLIYV